jgi:signal transduction histidine kinase
MNFRRRLLLFLIVTLIVEQALTAGVVFGFLRVNLMREGEQELAASAEVFVRQLDVVSERVADGVNVLSLDYALRKAVGEQDLDTIDSMLRNHGTRVGATRMMLVGLDSLIVADTAKPKTAATPFPFASLIEAAVAGNKGTSVAVLDGEVYWIVVEPVRAPQPIAFIAAFVPMNDALLERLHGLSPLMRSLGIATLDANGEWKVSSRTSDYSPVALPRMAVSELPEKYLAAASQKDGRLVMLARLPSAVESAPAIAILDYPLDEVLDAFTAIFDPMLLIMIAVLAIAIAGAMMIARGMSRPLEDLANAAKRIARGDYSPVDKAVRADEVGALSNALNHMTSSIAEREMALRNAVATIEAARTEAVKANEAKTHFLSNMSHELRTPLNAILGFSEMIARQMMGAVGNPRYTEYAGHIHSSGGHLLKQVEEMLDLSEASDGKLRMVRRRLSAGRVLTAAVESMRGAAKKAGIRLEIGGDPAAWPAIEADADKLEHGIANLVHNAIKFSERGATVRISGEVAGKTLTLSIADTGIGIAEEDLHLVVRPFSRRRPAFDARYQGAGLGLPFAKTIVELHGGKLAIQSAKGMGTTVTVELPLAAGEIFTHAA